jgi:hypothetical protein
MLAKVVMFKHCYLEVYPLNRTSDYDKVMAAEMANSR